MPAIDAYQERKFQRVMQDTWGHLRAKPGTRYPVSFVFGRDLEGYATLLVFDSPDTLNDSPWLHEDTHDRIEYELERAGDRLADRDDLRGRLWQFDGEYVVYKNGTRRFVGRTQPVKLLRPHSRGRERHGVRSRHTS